MLSLSSAVNCSSPVCDPRPVIVGSGPNGNDIDGPIIRFTEPGDGIIYTGQGAPFRATGGRIERCKIIRGGSVDGGVGLSVKTISDAERPGEVVLSDLKILSQRDLAGTQELARWREGLVADGTSQSTPGAAGLRVLQINGLRVASCTGDGDFVRFDNCVHLSGSRIQIDPGRIDTGKRAVMRIRGGQNIHLDSLIINGDVIVEGAAKYVVLSGFMDTVRVGRGVECISIQGNVRNLSVEVGVKGRCLANIVGGGNVVNRSSSSFKVF